MIKEDLYAPIREKYQNLKTALEGNDLEEMIRLTLDVHAMVHPQTISGAAEKTIADYVMDYMMSGDHQKQLVPRMNCDISLEYAGTDTVPMCWHFWHIYRIEDLVSNFLIADQDQIFDQQWQARMNSPITDTGNALESAEAADFGDTIDVKALQEYMLEVGKNTRKIIADLMLEKIRAKPSEKQLKRIVQEGGLTSDKRSIWLLDYWGSLTVAEMILTPLTDHHMMHLPPCLDQLPMFKI